MVEKLPDWQTDVALLRDFAQVRLIVADLDGSLVHASAHVVYSSLTNLQRSLNHHKNRVGFTLATGRAWNGAKMLVESLSIPKGAPLILYNGALTLECGTSGIIDRHCIDVSAVDKIRIICSSYAVTAYFYDFADPIFESFQHEPAERVVADGPAIAPCDFNGLHVHEGSWNTETLVHCTAILIDIGQLGDTVFRLRDSLSNVNEVTCTQSGARYIEIRPTGANKGSALRVVAEHLDLDMQRILALGDNDNDAEMLSVAGIGVAVKGASPAAMDASNYVCNHGPAEGAVEILRLIKHARRFYASSRTQVEEPA